MCGIAGFIDKAGHHDPDACADIVAAMSDTLAHRGPDGSGAWVDKDAGLALGNRRLAVIDLSKSADQPMISSCGRFVLTYNGEVYNAPELRRRLKDAGRSFRGHSDTEVLLEACACWGLRRTLPELDGMFAFALWDRQDRTLYVVRDRLGIKPVYWADTADHFLFASELKGLCAYPGFKPTILPGAVAAYLRHSYVPAPYSIYQGVSKLEPGTMLIIRKGKVSVEPYWDLRSRLRAATAASEPHSREEALSVLEERLNAVVERQMRSDVPVGILFSGGIDSTVLAALACGNADRPVRTFSLGFSEPEYDETPYAEAVARAIGTRHESFEIRDADLPDAVARLPAIFDEPFADSSQIPSTILCSRIRETATVALSGEGGDELFAGYGRYFRSGLNAWIDALPEGARRGLARAIESLPPRYWNGVTGLLPRRWRPRSPGAGARFLAGMLRDTSTPGYRRLMSHWHVPLDILPGVEEIASPVWSETLGVAENDPLLAMQLTDLLTYLPDDLLVKMDRASMAASLEVRVPYLDHELVEWVMNLPLHLRYDANASKWMLRRIAAKYVPEELIERPKMGFACPLEVWLRGPLRQWADDLLCGKPLGEDGLLEPGPIRKMWGQHKSGDANWHYQLWIVLQFLEWRRVNSI